MELNAAGGAGQPRGQVKHQVRFAPHAPSEMKKFCLASFHPDRLWHGWPRKLSGSNSSSKFVLVRNRQNKPHARR